jgi:subtilisin family serine protease
LRAANPQIPPIDLNGHGTACAGIAAGNGNALRKEYAGVAPGADLVIVRVGDASKRMVTEYLGGAIFDWLEKIAGSTPMVVSCSFGGFNCGHDGFTIFERQIDARFSVDRPGRAIIVAAGNNGTLPMHAVFSFEGDDAPAKLSWTCPSPTQMQIYVRANKRTDFHVIPGTGTTLPSASSALNALSGQVILVENLLAGSGSLSLGSRSGNGYQADAYFLDPAARFTSNNEVIEHMIDTPGCSANAITVGSYNWNNLVNLKGKTVSLRDSSNTTRSITIGEISAYSTPGYWRIGSAVKPEITAPGQWWMAPAPQNLPSVDSMRDGSGKYRVFNGTSAATPYVAGIVALMMEKNPKQTLGQIRQALIKCVGNDEFTGGVPNIHWGYGKLDYDAVERLLAGKYTVWVYKFSSGRWIKQDDRMLSTDDAAQAKSYAAEVNQTQGWKATTNIPAN